MIHTEEKESENDKSKERQQRRNCTKTPKSLPSGERLSGVFTRFLSDEPLEDKSGTLSTTAGWERYSQSTMYDRQRGEQTPALAGITVKMRQEQGGAAFFRGAEGRT